MREVFSFIFDKFTDPLTLPIEPLYEWIILGVIGLIAYIASFRIVGDMYDSGSISGSFLGSLCHWIIRLLIFIPVWFVVYWAIVIVQWIMAHWLLTLCILGGLAVAIGVAFGIVYYVHCKNE